MTVSVVIPCYNSAEMIEKVVDLTEKQLSEMGYNSEFVLVNDFSRDSTLDVLRKLAGKKENVTVVDLAKNTGQHNAIMAGFHYISGSIVVGMDDDMQTHPSQLPALFSRLFAGFDIVYGKYDKKKESLFRRLGSGFNDCTLRKMIKQPKEITTSSYWVAKRFVIDEVMQYKHAYTNLRGLFFRTSGRIGDVRIKHFQRETGTSTYTMKKLISLWSSCINFSVLPLRISMVIGCVSAAMGLAGAVIIVLRKLTGVSLLAGWSSTMTVLFFFFGIILMCLGVIGEYVGRIFMCINMTPQYVIREVISEKKEGS